MSDLAGFYEARRRRFEQDEASRFAAEESERQREKADSRAKNEAIKAAALADPNHPKAIQAKHAEGVKRQKAEQKAHHERIMKRAEDDRKAKKERDEREKQSRHAMGVDKVNGSFVPPTRCVEGPRRLDGGPVGSGMSPENDDGDIFDGDGEESDEEAFGHTGEDRRLGSESPQPASPGSVESELEHPQLGQASRTTASRSTSLASEGRDQTAHSPTEVVAHNSQPIWTPQDGSASDAAATLLHTKLHQRTFTDRNSYGEHRDRNGNNNNNNNNNNNHNKKVKRHTPPRQTSPSTSLFNAAAIPDDILRDVLLARLSMCASSHDVVTYVRSRHQGRIELHGMREDHVSELVTSAKQKHVLSKADQSRFEEFGREFGSRWTRLMKGKGVGWVMGE